MAVDVPGLRHGTRATWPGAATGSSSSSEHGETLDLAHVERLTDVTLAHPPGRSPRQRHHRRRRRRRSTTSSCSARRRSAQADSRNFVLCPGKAYDRSPCGTGTSAKLACLAADGKLAPGESGGRRASSAASSSRASGSTPGGSIPSISGQAYRHGRERRCCSTSPIRSPGLPRVTGPRSRFRRCRSRGRRRRRRDRGGECAYFLRQTGRRVTIVWSAGAFGRGCSHGNCGYICPSHVLPLAEPGALQSALKTLLAEEFAADRCGCRLDPGPLGLVLAIRPPLQ